MLILASKSKSRQDLLDAAGIEFQSISAGIDEDAIKSEMRLAGQDSKQTSLKLATEKAMAVSKKYPNAFVIGADQILDMRGEWFSKPANLSMAHKHLKKLRNKTHLLVNGTAVVRNGKLIWFDNSVVKVTMRDFSDNFLSDYLAEAGEDVCYSVGAYYMEDLGAQLVKSFEGDYFSILGLPLLSLMDCLRQCGELKK